LENLDLRYNRIGNQGAKAIMKGLNLNKTVTILEISGSNVSDDILRQINDLLVRNKNGDPISASGNLGGSKMKRDSPQKVSFGANQDFYIQPRVTVGAPLQQPPSFNHNSNIYGGFSDPHLDDEFNSERQAIEDRRLNLAKELEEETTKRMEAEDQLAIIKEEFMKKELEDSRAKSEMEARME
jgi:hypothetical protein